MSKFIFMVNSNFTATDFNPFISLFTSLCLVEQARYFLVQDNSVSKHCMVKMREEVVSM